MHNLVIKISRTYAVHTMIIHSQNPTVSEINDLSCIIIIIIITSFLDQPGFLIDTLLRKKSYNNAK